MPGKLIARGEWKTSSYTAGNSNCVEIALVAGRQGVAVRDTKDRTLPMALIPTAAWTTFLTSLKGNRE